MKINRLLIAEDDTDIQKVIRMSLRVRGVADVLITENGEECLEVAGQSKPDVILLDVMMPKLDGYETCRRLKANPETSSIPVIFLTAKAQHYEVKQGLEAGGLGYLIKPFDPMTLHDQIVSILNSSTQKQD